MPRPQRADDQREPNSRAPAESMTRSFIENSPRTNRIRIASNIRHNFEQIFRTGEWSLSRGMTIPALILLYSAIDIAAGLASTVTGVSGKQQFLKWVNRYMAPEKNLSCTALDLYGARCGSVHGFTPVSTLSQRGQARQVLYVLGKSNPAKLRELISIAHMDHYVVIHADLLLKAARTAVERFLRDARKSQSLTKRINRNAFTVFGNVTDAKVDALLDWGKHRLADG